MLSRWTAASLIALLGVALALPAAAQWKWRDKNGLTQYSDLPPPQGVADKDILQRPAAAQKAAEAAVPLAATPAAVASSAATASASAGRPAVLTPKSAEPELEAKRKQAEQAEADKRKADDARVAAGKADNCVRSRAQLRTLDSGQRIARVNDKGERIVLDDAARAEETRRAQDGISSNCQ